MTFKLDQVDQSVFTVCPSVPDIRPSMVFVFEVFLLRGPMVPTDRVVAWGAFPLCDKECRLAISCFYSVTEMLPKISISTRIFTSILVRKCLK